MKKVLLILFCISLAPALRSQSVNQQRVDSLMNRLNESVVQDTNRIQVLLLLANTYLSLTSSDEEKKIALAYIEKAKVLADSLQYRRGQLGVLSFYGLYYQTTGNFASALEKNLEAVKIAEELKRPLDVLRIKNSIGAIYFSMSDNENALRFYEEVLKLAEENNRPQQLSQVESNIGIIYHRKKEYGKALDYYTRSLRSCEKAKNERTKGHVYNSLGRLFFDMALEDQENQTMSSYNQSLDKAIQYYNQSLEIKRKQKDQRGLANTLGNIAVVYKERGLFDRSLEYYSEGLKIAQETNYFDWLKEGYSGMYELYDAKGDYKNALKFFILYKTHMDSMASASVRENMAELQGKYNTEKKDKEIELYKKEQDLANSKLSQQRLVIWFSGAGLLVVVVFSFFLYRGFKDKQRINAIIEGKNKSITDSIVYARRIQTAILPSEEQLKAGLGDHFIYYKPKDIVSGDFYFFSRAGDRSIFAVADCTGHGVPGAFMSMIGNSLLSEIINEKRILQPGEILDNLHTGVVRALQQHDDADTNDGMDIAICSLDLKTGNLEYAGANRNLWIEHEGSLEEIIADKFPIGGRQAGADRKFNSHQRKAQKGSMIYLSTDGFADQFGGAEGKKFRTKRFKELLTGMSKMTVAEQRNHLEITMQEWMRDTEQLDDILVAGIRIT